MLQIVSRRGEAEAIAAERRINGWLRQAREAVKAARSRLASVQAGAAADGADFCGTEAPGRTSPAEPLAKAMQAYSAQTLQSGLSDGNLA